MMAEKITSLNPEILIWAKNASGLPVEELDTIVSLIVSVASPDIIILFGSYARGDNNEKSDIDLLIVKKGLRGEREITGSIYMTFYENKIRIPVDVLAIDYERYLELNNEIGYVYKTIKEEGKVIYGTI
jgi:predicted nucleotidyltransferase